MKFSPGSTIINLDCDTIIDNKRIVTGHIVAIIKSVRESWAWCEVTGYVASPDSREVHPLTFGYTPEINLNNVIAFDREPSRKLWFVKGKAS